MKAKRNSLLTISLCLIFLSINANDVFLKNLYTTSTGTEKPVTVSLNNDSKEIPFNTTVNLGKLNNVKKLTIKTSSTLPVVISKIEQIKKESPHKEGQNALLIIYPSLPTNLGAWNIERQWLPQRPTSSTSTTNPQTSPTQPTAQKGNANEQFCNMTYEEKLHAIKNNFLGDDPSSDQSYKLMLSMIKTLSEGNPNRQKNWDTLKELLSEKTDNIIYIYDLKKAITRTYNLL